MKYLAASEDKLYHREITTVHKPAPEEKAQSQILSSDLSGVALR